MFVNLNGLILLGLWIFGIVVAKGFWSTFFAVTFIPYSWYLAVEHMLRLWGVI